MLTVADLPPAYESSEYRSCWPDLGHLADPDLEAHYRQNGEAEGRRANRLSSRADFVGLIPPEAAALEIGPFYSPLLTGPGARFFDVLDQAGLQARASALGGAPANVPRIDYVSPVGNLSIIGETFDYVLSSHCLEHQPDLIGHLREVSRILRPGGRYLLLVPDKRYCFDAFIAESTIAEVVDAHVSGRKVHLLRSIIEHRALTTHNDVKRHWAGDHGALEAGSRRLTAAMAEHAASNGGYVDVHAWYFTPRSARSLIDTLRAAGLIDFTVERLYPTRLEKNEFWMVLQTPSQRGVNSPARTAPPSRLPGGDNGQT